MKASTLAHRLGTAIRRRREALGQSQEDFAEAIDMHRTYYSSIERGERNLTVATLERVAAGLKAKPSELFADAGA